MDPTALYYTFSTIAQALAGAFGVLAAFAILALTRIETEISSARDTVMELRQPWGPAWETFRQHGLDEFIRRELSGWNPSALDVRLSRLRDGEVALRSRAHLQSQLIVASALTGGAIGISIIALPFVPILASSAALSIIVTAAAITLVIACLVLYGRVVLGMIRGDVRRQSAPARRQSPGAGP